MKYKNLILNKAIAVTGVNKVKNIGCQMEFARQFKKSGQDNFFEWQKEFNPLLETGLSNCREKVLKFVANIKEVAEAIIQNPNQVDEYFIGLINKTPEGLRVQNLIIKKVAEKEGARYKRSTPKQDSQGIDGWIFDKKSDNWQSVSIKPDSVRASGGDFSDADRRFYYTSDDVEDINWYEAFDEDLPEVA
jgi:hypothetical protein